MSEVETFSFSNLDEAKRELAKINVNSIGIKIIFKVVKIKKVDPKTANIVKQEMLSRGGEVAVADTVGQFGLEATDILVMGTLAQYIRLIKKLQHQDYGDCKKISDLLKEALFSGFDVENAEVW
jgi:dihydropteroate synthase